MNKCTVQQLIAEVAKNAYSPASDNIVYWPLANNDVTQWFAGNNVVTEWFTANNDLTYRFQANSDVIHRFNTYFKDIFSANYDVIYTDFRLTVKCIR
jgi:hypothetical protein